MEEWKDIVGYEGLYQVSDIGRIYSIISERTLRESCDKDNYRLVTLYLNKKPVGHRVHSLVLRAFVGPYPVGSEIGHLDGNPENNNLSNLKYMSHRCNLAFKSEHGTNREGKDNPNSKLLKSQVVEIKKLLRKQDAL